MVDMVESAKLIDLLLIADRKREREQLISSDLPWPDSLFKQLFLVPSEEKILTFRNFTYHNFS